MSIAPKGEAPRNAVLLATNDAWIYKSLKGGLKLSGRYPGADGRAYDVGELPGQNGTWRVYLAANTTVDGELAYYDVRPVVTLVLLDAEKVLAPTSRLTGVVGMLLAPPRDEHPPVRLLLHQAVTVGTGETEARVPPDGSMKLAVERLTIQPEATPLGSPLTWSSAAAIAAPKGYAALVSLAASGDASPPAMLTVERTTGGSYTPNARAQAAAFVSGVRALLAELPVAVIHGPTSGGDGVPTEPVHGSLKRFDLHAVRSINRLEWAPATDGPGWHVVLGDNASGKTTLLRCLALVLLDPHGRDALRQDWGSWLQKGMQQGGVRATIQAAGDNPHDVVFSFARERSGNGAGLGGAVSVGSSAQQYGGFLAAYGPIRRFTGGDPEWAKDLHALPRVQRVLTLFDERAILSDALEWIKDLWVRAKTIKKAPEKAFLRDLRAFINETGFFPAGTVLDEPDADGVWCRDGAGDRRLVIDLSHGYRAALSLALDLLRHLALDRGLDKVFTATSPGEVHLTGIVLIDEPDTHLHPTWQQRIGAWFKRAFPKMQFIVATHSAIVCQAADSVLHLPTPGSNEAPRMATPAELKRFQYGNLLDAFGTGLFGVGTDEAVAGRALLERLAMLNQIEFERPLTEAEAIERRDLRATLPSRGATSRAAP